MQKRICYVLVCHVTTNHHVFRGSCDSIGGFRSPKVPNLPYLVVIDLAGGEILKFQFATWLHVITWSESHLTLWMSFPHHKSPLCQIWWQSVLQKMRYFVFNLSGDLLWPRGQRVPVIVSIHPVKFGGHRHCAREKILLFVCHVTTHDFVIRESYDMGEFSSSFMTTLQRLVIIDLLEDEILSFQFVTWFHVITWSEGHVTSWMSSPHHKSLPC